MTKGAILFLVGVVGFSAQGKSLSLSELQAKLNSRSATWVAGETSVSRLSQEEIKKRLGAELPEGFEEPFSGDVKVRTARPASLDWRNVSGVNYASPILNQASCGSCVAFAAVATMETQMNITRKTPQSPWQFSPQHLFSCGGGMCEKGWTPFSALTFLKDQGVPDETCFPYTAGAMGEDVACSKTCANAANRSTKIVSYSAPTLFLASPEMVKQALQKGPLLGVMRVYEDFLYYKSGVYKHVSGEMAGGHAISIVGYNDADQAWIVRNSWGEEWGENGYFRIAYNDVSGVGSQTFAMVVPAPQGFVAVNGIRDNEILSGSVSVNIESTFSGTQSVEWTLNRDGVPVWWGAAALGRPVAIDTTQFKDGSYTLVGKATHSGGVAESQPRMVHVLNGNFTGGVEFTDLQNGDVVTGQRYLKIGVKNSPVPFTKIVLKVKNVSTGEESIRSTYHSLPELRFTWRAQLLPKGEYELSLNGYVGKLLNVASTPVKVSVQ